MSGPLAGKRHLILVGLMGTGKTTAGMACARTLARPFVDTDHEIEHEAGVSVAEIFAREGEPGFRARERQVVHATCYSTTPSVIACGGGAVLDETNRADMRRNGVVVWLTAPADVLAARVGPDSERPLLGSDPHRALGELAAARHDLYAEVADARVDTADRDPDAVAAAVLDLAGVRA